MPAMTSETGTAVPPYTSTRFRYYTESFSLYFLAFIGGLAWSRILYEWLFPRAWWLARPYGALPFAAVVAFVVWAVWMQQRGAAPSPFQALTLSPLFLNLLWLADPTVDLVRSRFLFAATVWLTAVFIFVPDVWIDADAHKPDLNLPLKSGILRKSTIYSYGKRPWLGLMLIVAALGPVYLLTMSHAVGAADTFEFQVVTPRLGIVHPTGYPLYLLLGKLFTWLPLGSLAWRLNFASVLYALAAMSLFYGLLVRCGTRPWPAILGAVVTGLTLTFWSQAIVAEVYALHALIVMGTLYLMAVIGGWRIDGFNARGQRRTNQRHHLYLLALLLGLGLTNHITTVFLIPPAILTVFFAYWPARQSSRLKHHYHVLFKTLAAFLLPLLLYVYLPLRWQAVNGEAMGLARFVDWVIGGRFQGALQLRAWLADPTRYEIVGRLFLDNWGWFNLGLAAVGLGFLWWRRWQTAVPLFLTWLGYTFYALNYYVPDLAVFTIPAQVIVGLWWALGVAAIFEIGKRRLEIKTGHPLPFFTITFVLIPTLLLVVAHWPLNDQSNNDGLEAWGRGVLALPLAPNAAILADSEKIAPLLYLQVAAGLRPDVDISVWPDEAAYRAQVDGRIAQGQTVYLARFLPGLQSVYHLRALGPLTEVATTPMTQLPDQATPLDLDVGPMKLVGYALEPVAVVDAGYTAVTLYWQADEPVNEVLHVYVNFKGYPTSHGQHPANNFYPTNAWQPGEIVPDYHLLPRPLTIKSERLSEPLTLQAALAAPFTPPDQLVWQPVTTFLTLEDGFSQVNPTTHLRSQVGLQMLVGLTFPSSIRPQATLPLTIKGYGHNSPSFDIDLRPVNEKKPVPLPLYADAIPVGPPHIWRFELTADLPVGNYEMIARDTTSADDCQIGQRGCSKPASFCGWMQAATEGCVLGVVEISGVALPDTAVNYQDQIALLDITVAEQTLQPGGQLHVTLNWQALEPLAENYTLFLQVVNEHDHIVGQVDSWPVQGTFPTSQWSPGKMVNDAYTIQLASELPPGPYRLLVGWYLLGTSRRLPILNQEGAAVDDKWVMPGLSVP